jgi:hypothetical protein
VFNVQYVAPLGEKIYERETYETTVHFIDPWIQRVCVFRGQMNICGHANSVCCLSHNHVSILQLYLKGTE